MTFAQLLLAAALLAACVMPVALVAVRNFRAAHGLLEREPASGLLSHPDRTGVADLAEIAFRSADGVHIAGWYVPSRNRAAVILVHGTNSDRSHMLPELRLFAAAGYGVLAFDWPGLGASEGAIRWDDGAGLALAAALDFLALRPEIDPQRIGGLGFSMGGLVMTRFGAHDSRLRAMVLEGTPGDVREYTRLHFGRWGPLGLWPARAAIRGSGLLAAELAPVRLIGSLAPRPLLIIGGTEDAEIPAAMVRELYAAAREPKALWIVQNAGHGGYATAEPVEYPRRLLAFFDAALRPAPLRTRTPSAIGDGAAR